MAAVIDRAGPCTLQPHDDYYRELAESIVSQQLSTKAAATIIGRFRELGADGFPSPQEVLGFEVERLRGVGLSGAKARYIQDLAQHVVDGRLRIEQLLELTNDEIIVELTDIKGIGEWTAQMFLIFSLGRLDVLPTGDLGIRKGMQALYDLAELPSPTQMQTVAERNHWSPYRTVAAWYIWRSLDL